MRGEAAQAKFLTPAQLLARIEKKQIRILFKQGAYVRTAMARSMRYVGKDGKPSAPGRPPKAHRDTKKGPLLRKLISFSVDQKNKSVIIGPQGVGSDSPPIPKVLNEGGRPAAKRLNAKGRNFQTGDYGPIRQGNESGRYGGLRFVGTKLLTAGQVARAERLILEENERRATIKLNYIRPRPFTAPVMTDGGEKFKKLFQTVPL
jgi:hypothetical protein